MSVRMQHCEWCGEELGMYDNYREPQSCWKAECNRKVRAMLRAEEEERAERAKEDRYERYRR